MKKLFYRNKSTIAIIFVLLSIKSAHSKNIILLNDTLNKIDTSKCYFPKNNFNIVLYGETMLYSVNYERSVFSIKNNNLSLRIGYSIVPIQGYLHMYLLSVNYNKFINKKLLFSLGTNLVLTSKENKNYYFAINSKITYFVKDFFIQGYLIKFTGLIGPSYGFGISIGFKFGKY